MKRFDDDETLRSALRDVKVPGDLKDRLREISDAEPSAEVADTYERSTQRHRKLAVSMMVVLAAVFAGLAIKIFWPADVVNDPSTNVADQEQRTPSVEEMANSNGREKSSPNQELIRKLEDNASFLEEFVIAQKIQRLERQLANEEKELRRARRFLSPDESASIVLTLAGQTAIQMGVGQEQVSRQLNDVIQRFPGTGGAKLAEEILRSELN